MVDTIKDVIAIMAIKTNEDVEAGKMTYGVENDEFGGLLLVPKKEVEVEVYTEEDFEEPKRENFEEMVKQVLAGTATDDENVTIKLLKEASVEGE
ncbi:hypothetical protein [Listeria phage List-36]|nr:hypothetical protein QLX35_gp051 [Listeria phage LP-125]YP_009043515.1 hypothetical protein HH35_gp144 [Listeria phage List-36]YP_009592580.1 hypothetical protein FDG78_gp051 [Listeria phage LP-064]YP_406516.1 gp140 [Listeria phage P100]QIG60781.1 hypothetical protein vBLinoVEfB7_038 [Listeria phage vB_Lino_VEfB7]QJB22409.1 hypothetical protein [Listeria phage P100plus]QJB22599.1 hypothetical protein [Listeria phage P200]QKN84236.1 hypothetical protein [Listeria virus P61]QNL31994.1 hypo